MLWLLLCGLLVRFLQDGALRFGVFLGLLL